MAPGAARSPAPSGPLWAEGSAPASGVAGSAESVRSSLLLTPGAGGAVFTPRACGVGVVSVCRDEMGMEFLPCLSAGAYLSVCVFRILRDLPWPECRAHGGESWKVGCAGQLVKGHEDARNNETYSEHAGKILQGDLSKGVPRPACISQAPLWQRGGWTGAGLTKSWNPVQSVVTVQSRTWVWACRVHWCILSS